MPISMISIEDLTERELRKDPQALRDFYRRGRFFRSDVRKLSEAELVEKLRSFGLDWSREDFRREAEPYFSAEQLVKKLTETKRLTLPDGVSEDWPWMTLCILWERWLPDRPSFEMLNDLMQAGYVEQEKKDGSVPACELWWRAWEGLVRVLRESVLKTVSELDEVFGGTQSVFNWMQDFEGELYNAGLKDRQYLAKRIEFCEELIPRLDDDDTLTKQNFHRAIAESHAYMGNLDLADKLFEQWLQENPQWGWGWIGWSDLYGLCWPAKKDHARAEAILRQGLAVPDVDARSDLFDRLIELCKSAGRNDEVKELGRQARAAEEQERRQRAGSFRTSLEKTSDTLRAKTTMDFGEEGLPLDQLSALANHLRALHEAALFNDDDDFDELADGDPFLAAPSDFNSPPMKSTKIGRNELCYCGSGKKYKKCCGKNG